MRVPCANNHDGVVLRTCASHQRFRPKPARVVIVAGRRQQTRPVVVWCRFSLALLLPSVRLPAIYPLVFALLVSYLALSATCTYTGMGPGNVTMAAGASILAASFLLFWGYLAASLAALKPGSYYPKGPSCCGLERGMSAPRSPASENGVLGRQDRKWRIWCASTSRPSNWCSPLGTR